MVGFLYKTCLFQFCICHLWINMAYLKKHENTCKINNLTQLLKALMITNIQFMT